MKFKEFPFKKSKVKSWEEVFHNPRPITLETFNVGTVVINRRGTLNPVHPHAETVLDEQMEVPLLAHLVHHEKKGDYLLDAGLDASYYLDSLGGLEGSEVDEFNQNKNENIAYHLDRNNIHLKGVFFSHLHADHAAGQRELPHDIPYAVSNGEYEDYHPEVHGDFLAGLANLEEIDFTKADNIPPLGPTVDLLGDGSLWAISTQGHTRGHISFLVNGLDGPVFLTMDAAFIQENLDRGVAPRDYTWDVEMAQETLEKIIKFLGQYPQCRVRVGHEL
ncbi:MAG: MBL fold metallo-hydrolase [Methanobacteriaceae archaeon]|nr:MBL fold metallo-hydrolase [Methanobacteriaceae archaeon]